MYTDVSYICDLMEYFYYYFAKDYYYNLPLKLGLVKGNFRYSELESHFLFLFVITTYR